MDIIGEETLHVMKEAGWYNNWLFSIIKPYIKSPVLEIGAGIGNFTKLLVKEFDEVIAVDFDENYIKKLRKQIKNLKVGFGDIERGKYFFRNQKFNSIICMNVLEHIKGDQKALGNMFDLLYSGGRLVLLVPAHQAAFGTLDVNLGHFRRYSKNNLKAKLENQGFRVEEVRHLNFLGILGWFVNARILKRMILPKYQLKIFDKITRPILILEKFIKFPFGLSILVVATKK